jgi:hypothetical protein
MLHLASRFRMLEAVLPYLLHTFMAWYLGTGITVVYVIDVVEVSHRID